MQERRIGRSESRSQALALQLERGARAGGLAALAVVDEDGLELSGWGEPLHRAQLAGQAVAAGRHCAHFAAAVEAQQRRWVVETARIRSHGASLYVCAIGGTAAGRARQLGRCALGALRILAA
jgi:hypothetical protein